MLLQSKNTSFKSKQEFVEQLKEITKYSLGKNYENCNKTEKYRALSLLIASKARDIKSETTKENGKKKQLYYFSIEFLIGRLLENYILNLGVSDIVREGLSEFGDSLEEICEYEKDPGLGNGGLGRLAACFMDSLAALNLPGNGNGIRYRYGLFKQKIEHGKQVEYADDWLQNDSYPWEHRNPSDAVLVRFGGEVVKHVEGDHYWFTWEKGETILAVPYDIPILGFDGKCANNLRLWEAVPSEVKVDLEEFNKGNYPLANRYESEIKAITDILYPNDHTDNGKILRLKQEYMFVAAGITNIINTYKKNHGSDFSHFSDYVAIHTNDTHPALCGIELMRKLIDEEKVEWEDAWNQVIKTVSFTNHTVLPEASETWDVNMFRRLLPRHFTFIEEIDRRFRESFPRDKVNDAGYVIQQTCIIGAGKVRMANLSIICSYSVNGVAKLHTQILKDLTLHNFYQIYPEKFNNKTNGISHRRFLAQSNPGLKKLLDNTLGSNWIADIEKLSELESKLNDTNFLQDLDKIKTENKIRLANYVKQVNGTVINPNTIFDIQVKRFHAYKRQQLNVFKIIELYFKLKEDPSFKIEPTTFIFSGKAAQGYDFAKDIIRLIHSVAHVINNDPQVNEIIKVCFIPNFNVSNAQIIYPACDISEQISTAGKEASGTGNMKFMMNGAFTLGTLDGANIEISEQVGDDNIKIFGLKANEIEDIKNNHSYYAYDLYNNDHRIKRIMDTLTNDTFGELSGDFYLVFDEILRQNDEYFVLKDFASYMDAWHYVNNLYASNKEEWLKKSLINISRSAFFSSDRTIKEYASEIWHI